MSNIEDLMFKREDFPVEIREVRTQKGTQYVLGDTVTPPYHPSMTQSGIDIGLALYLAHDALIATVEELRGIQDRVTRARDVVYDFDRLQPEFGEAVTDGNGKTIGQFPILGRLHIAPDRINNWGYGQDHNISIYPDMTKGGAFTVPGSVIFSPELMREYEMIDGGSYFDGRWINCKNTWYRHNVDSKLAQMFYKNLVIALDNAIVRAKYGQVSVNFVRQ